MASARKTVIPRMTATRPRDRASGEIRTRGAGVLPGAEIVVTVGLLQDRASLLTRRGDGEVSDSPARRGRLAHSGATVLDSHQLPWRRHARRTVQAGRPKVNHASRYRSGVPARDSDTASAPRP